MTGFKCFFPTFLHSGFGDRQHLILVRLNGPSAPQVTVSPSILVNLELTGR